MNISNFRNLKINRRKGVVSAEVDVTNGFWLWKTTETKRVFTLSPYFDSTGKMLAAFWHWEDGSYTPKFVVENLYNAYFYKSLMDSDE